MLGGVGGSGLSKSHISPQAQNGEVQRPPYRLERWEKAGLVRVVSPYLGPPVDPEKDDDAKRGEIIEFSKSAQRRLMQFLAKIPDGELLSSFMITLTYPGNACPEAIPEKEDSAKYKRHLDTLAKALKRKYPGSSAVWVLEFQKRGAAHYHALLFGIPVDQLAECRQWLAETWNRIAGMGDAQHLQAGTQCDLARSAGGARNYLAKYLSKGNQAAEGVKVGRYWGKINKKAVPLGVEVVETLTPSQTVLALRVARKLAAKRQWDGGWNKLKKQAGKGNPCFETMTMMEFRKMCRAFQSGKTAFCWNNGVGEAFVSVLSLQYAVTGDSFKSIRWPWRPRSRNNSTVNLYCNADHFWPALTRHPKWNDEEKKEDSGGRVRESGRLESETICRPYQKDARGILGDDVERGRGWSQRDDEAPHIRVPENWPALRGGVAGETVGLRREVPERGNVVLGDVGGSERRKAPRVYHLDASKRFQRDPF